MILLDRMETLAGWREIVLHGADEERRALVESLRDVDIAPLYSAIDEDDDEVTSNLRRARMTVALDALGRLAHEALREGRHDDGERWLDLRLSVEAQSG